jgi:TusA-related sulfurtransferase
MTDMTQPPVLDLSLVKCPLNFVKAKLALEKLPMGSPLLIQLGYDLTMNVPASLRQEGYTVTERGTNSRGLLIEAVKLP